jgi:hypothetical protein
MTISSALERVAALSSRRYYPFSKPHGITLRKTIISISTSMKTSHPIHSQYFYVHYYGNRLLSVDEVKSKMCAHCLDATV